MPPFGVTVTSEHVHDGALQSQGQRFGAGEAAGPAGQVLGRDRELAAGLSHQQAFAGPGEGEGQPVECHIVGRTRCLAPSTALLACAVPVPALALAVGRGGGKTEARGQGPRADPRGGNWQAPSNSSETLGVGGPGESPLSRRSCFPTLPITPAPSQESEGQRLQVAGLGIPDVAVLMDGSVGWIPLPAMAAGTELRRHTALVLGRGQGQGAP